MPGMEESKVFKLEGARAGKCQLENALELPGGVLGDGLVMLSSHVADSTLHATGF